MLLFLRATKSRVLYEQFLGRILRQYYDGKPKTAIVLDPRYQQSKFSPLSAPMLYGVPGEQVTRGGILIGPRTSRGEKRILSPYLQEGIQSTITVKPLEIEYWTDEKGLVEIEGETWGTETGLAEALDLAEGTIRDRASDCHSRPGRCANGRSATLYLLRDVKKACANLIGPGVLQTGPDGTVWADGEIWGGVEALAPILLLSPTAIRNRKAYCRSRPGKGPRKRLTLYALKDMRKACADILPARGKN